MTRTLTDKNIDLSNNFDSKDMTSEISRENTVLLINPVCYSNFDNLFVLGEKEVENSLHSAVCTSTPDHLPDHPFMLGGPTIETRVEVRKGGDLIPVVKAPPLRRHVKSLTNP